MQICRRVTGQKGEEVHEALEELDAFEHEAQLAHFLQMSKLEVWRNPLSYFPIKALGAHAGTQLLPVVGFSIAFGVLFGTVFILFFYPAAILYWNWRRRVLRFIRTWKWVDPLDVEPAFKLKDNE